MLDAQQVRAERELQLAAVAGSLAHAAMQRGGMFIATADDLHRLVATPSPLWPRSAMQLQRETLPTLERRPGHAGATVHALSGVNQWEVRYTPAPVPSVAA